MGVILAMTILNTWAIYKLRKEVSLLHEQSSHLVDFMWETYNKNKR